MFVLLALALLLINCASCRIESPFCSVRFEGLSNFVAKEIGPNTFHVQLTQEDLKEKNDAMDYGTNFPIAIFECRTLQYTKFQINSVEAITSVEFDRKRLLQEGYDPLTSSDNLVHFLRVRIPLQGNATGQYEFKTSASIFETFFIFAQTDSTRILGTGRKLKAVFIAENNVLLPCISPNPNTAMYLWRYNPAHESFEILWIDNDFVSYDHKQGFHIAANPNLKVSRIGDHYRCTLEKTWYTPPFVDIEVNQMSTTYEPDLKIKLLRTDGAECYGIPGSDVKLYKIRATVDEASEIVKCFEQRKNDCGKRPSDVKPVEVGQSLDSASSVSILRFRDEYGLLVCTSESEVASTWFFKGLDGKYYRHSDIDILDSDVMMRIRVIPDPDFESISSGSVLTVIVDTASGVFLESPRLLFVKYNNGSVSQLHGEPMSKSFLVTTDMTGIYVDDQFLYSGKSMFLLRSFQVNQRQCGVSEFRCDSGECIAIEKVCDHRLHCRDGKSDEINCEQFRRNCTRDEFRCASGQCINIELKCSGTSECFDNSDEGNNCFFCSASQFRCKNGQCIRKSDVCDSNFDCDDRSDETLDLCQDCNGDSEKFRCHTGVCISKTRLCDGILNCQDGSDEAVESCSGAAPVIVNDQSIYEFKLNSNSYLVCEVEVAQYYATQQRFQPQINWTYIAAPNTGQNFLKKNTDIQKFERETSSNSPPFTKFYFAYKFNRFSEAEEGIYKCTAHNEGGSHSKEFVAKLIPNDEACLPSSLPPRPEHENRPMGTEESDEFRCRGPGKFKDLENCSVFHDCVSTGSGDGTIQHYQYSCPPGTVFCAKLQICAWSKDCPCQSRS